MILNSKLLSTVPIQIPIGALWPSKHSLEELRVLETGDPYTYSAQMQQDPSPLGGGMFKTKWFKTYEVLPADIDVIRIYGDTAQKTKEHNDFTVYECWGHSRSTGIYLIDLLRGKWEAPEIESNLVDFWNKHKPTQYKPFGAQCVKIEDKSSGSSLIQSIKKDYNIPIEGIQRNTDKVLRCMSVVKYFASGFIHLPAGVVWLHDYKEEFRKFTPLMTHAHDDQIDPTVDAVEDMLVFEDMLYSGEALT